MEENMRTVKDHEKVIELLSNINVSDISIDTTNNVLFYEPIFSYIKQESNDGFINFDKLVKDEFGNYEFKAVAWLITNCKKLQTEKMLEFYKSLDPSYINVSSLIVNCQYCQTEEMLSYYKSLKPAYRDVGWLIKSCKSYQTEEMIEYYKSLDPRYKDVKRLIMNCKYCQTEEMVEYCESLIPKFLHRLM
jgi:hypothetical protein